MVLNPPSKKGYITTMAVSIPDPDAVKLNYLNTSGNAKTKTNLMKSSGQLFPEHLPTNVAPENVICVSQKNITYSKVTKQ